MMLHQMEIKKEQKKAIINLKKQCSRTAARLEARHFSETAWLFNVGWNLLQDDTSSPFVNSQHNSGKEQNPKQPE